MANNDLQRVAALLACGHLTAEEAVGLAEDWVLQGRDGEDVVALAGLSRREHGEALELLAKVLEREDVPMPSREEAAFRLALDELRAIASRTRDPIQGARWIWTEVWSDFHFDDFSPFVAMVADIDEASPAERTDIANSIVAKAKEIIGEGMYS